MELDLNLAVQVLQAQPFSRHLGTEITEFGGGAATLEIDVEDHHLQQNGFVHGGVLAYLCDNAITFAGGSVLGPEVLTGGLSIDYLAAAQGPRLVARAVVAHNSPRRATCRCEVFSAGDDSSSLCAVAQGTVIAR